MSPACCWCSELCRPGPGRLPLPQALRAFERDMCARTMPVVLKSRAAATQLHSGQAALAPGNYTRAAAAAAASVAAAVAV